MIQRVTSTLEPEVREDPFYLPVGGDKLYCVLHTPRQPIARVLAAGPFAAERPHSYSSLVRWARQLAAHGFQTLRFDYRGVGESTGRFEAMSFETWSNDVRLLAQWLEEQAGPLPLVFHGLGLGSLLAARAFSQGTGSSLLMWAAPQSEREVLMESLMRRISIDYVMRAPTQRKTLADYVSMLDSGETIEVEGYPWTNRLWDQAVRFNLSEMLGSENDHGSLDGRPWKSVRLDKSKVPLIAGLGTWKALNPRATVGRTPLSPDFRNFFNEEIAWLQASIERPRSEA